MGDRKVFKDSVTELPVDFGVTPSGLILNEVKPDTRDRRMDLLFSLEMPSKDDLEKRVAAGEIVSSAELNKTYSPKASDVDALKNWLAQQGFKVTGQSPDGTGVYANATVGQIQQSLAVKMVQVTKDGITYTAAQNAPSLPSDVGAPVHAILGLQPFRHAYKHKARLLAVHNRSTVDRNGQPVPNIENSPPYLVGEILKAYNADNLGVTGKGQTIAILIDTFPNDGDLAAFWSANGINNDPTRIKKIKVGSGHLPTPEGEETLDASWSSGIAPDATIKIYASGSLQFVALDQALDRIVSDASSDPTLRQLSISLGLGETFMGGPSGEVATQHQKFLSLAAMGVNVFVSSGDAGSNPGVDGHTSNGPLQAEYAASDSVVVGVGGTSLRLNSADGTVAGEEAWTGSGGGDSGNGFFSRPSWQTGTGVPPDNHRSVPDVSLAADPNEGAFLVLHGQPTGIGGTSWSAPMWAGICALINEARNSKEMPSLAFLNPQIYPLMGTPCFRDIVSGNNGAFTAGTGYDRVTGLGVPNVRELLASLTKAPAPAVAAGQPVQQRQKVSA
jgi:kumamolisin